MILLVRFIDTGTTFGSQSPPLGDRFRTSLALGNFDGQGSTLDLAVGVPTEEFSGLVEWFNPALKHKAIDMYPIQPRCVISRAIDLMT